MNEKNQPTVILIETNTGDNLVENTHSREKKMMLAESPLSRILVAPTPVVENRHAETVRAETTHAETALAIETADGMYVLAKKRRILLHIHAGDLTTMSPGSKQLHCIGLSEIVAVEISSAENDECVKAVQVVYKSTNCVKYRSRRIPAESFKELNHWQDEIRRSSHDAGAERIFKFHPGVWIKSAGFYSCCKRGKKTSGEHDGCTPTTGIHHGKWLKLEALVKFGIFRRPPSRQPSNENTSDSVHDSSVQKSDLQCIAENVELRNISTDATAVADFQTTSNLVLAAVSESAQAVASTDVVFLTEVESADVELFELVTSADDVVLVNASVSADNVVTVDVGVSTDEVLLLDASVSTDSVEAVDASVSTDNVESVDVSVSTDSVESVSASVSTDNGESVNVRVSTDIVESVNVNALTDEVLYFDGSISTDNVISVDVAVLTDDVSSSLVVATTDVSTEIFPVNLRENIISDLGRDRALTHQNHCEATASLTARTQSNENYCKLRSSLVASQNSFCVSDECSRLPIWVNRSMSQTGDLVDLQEFPRILHLGNSPSSSCMELIYLRET